MTAGDLPIGPADQDLTSPDPLVRLPAWGRFYSATAPALLAALRRRAYWLDDQDAWTVLHDAYLRTEATAPGPGSFPVASPLAVVASNARQLAIDCLRRQLAKKRGAKHVTVPLDTVSPTRETDLEVEAPPRDIGLLDELTARIRRLPKLQRLVAEAIFASPDSTAAEIAQEIAPALGRTPSVDTVLRSRAVIRQKLRPLAALIRKERER